MMDKLIQAYAQCSPQEKPLMSELLVVYQEYPKVYNMIVFILGSTHIKKEMNVSHSLYAVLKSCIIHNARDNVDDYVQTNMITKVMDAYNYV